MDNKSGISCSVGCWLLAAGAGFLAFILLMAVGEFALIPAVFLGGLLFIILGALLTWLFCTELPKIGDAAQGQSAGSVAAAGAAAGGVAAAATGSAVSASGTSSSDAAAAKAEADAAAAKAEADAAAAKAEADAAAAKAEADAAAAKAEADAAAAKAEADAAAAKAEADAAAAKAEADAAAAKAEQAASAKTAAKPKAKKAAAKKKDDAPANPGTRPEGLKEARAGGADDLKRIKGIGPKLEKLCNTLGFYHFDQIAAWGADEVAWVDQNLEGFKGRVTRDTWVEQAKLLAAGGETEFSKKVDDGDVY